MKTKLVSHLILLTFSCIATLGANPTSVALAATKPLSNEFRLNNESLRDNFGNYKSFSKAYNKALALKFGKSRKSVNSLVERYRMALASIRQNQPKMALKILPTPSAFERAGLPSDRLLLTQARAQYQDKNYAGAIATYSKIPQSSDLWIVAIEERAHTQGRSGKYEKALADLTTLFSPVFEPVLGPEAYFTAAITYLRLCQYSKVFETLNLFKERMKIRINDLTNVANGKADGFILTASQNLRSKGYNSISYAKIANFLPSSFHLDFTVRDQIQKSSNGMNSFVLLSRVAQLANEDLSEIKSNLNKLQLVEAEVMQRIHLAEKANGNKRNSLGQFKAEDNQLFFPYNGEVWIDELDTYQVQSKGCPKDAGGA